MGSWIPLTSQTLMFVLNALEVNRPNNEINGYKFYDRKLNTNF